MTVPADKEGALPRETGGSLTTSCLSSAPEGSPSRMQELHGGGIQVMVRKDGLETW